MTRVLCITLLAATARAHSSNAPPPKPTLVNNVSLLDFEPSTTTYPVRAAIKKIRSNHEKVHFRDFRATHDVWSCRRPRRLPARLLERLHFFTLTSCRNPLLLSKFLAFYADRGIHFGGDRVRVVLHAPPNTPGRAAAVAALDAAGALRNTHVEQRPYSSILLNELANDYLRSLPEGALLMRADSDELFDMDDDLLMRSGIYGGFVLGHMVDRIARDWTLGPYDGATYLWQAYPRRCPVTTRLLRSANTKWVLVPKAIDGVAVKWLNSHYLNVEPEIARRYPAMPVSLPFSHYRFAERAGRLGRTDRLAKHLGQVIDGGRLTADFIRHSRCGAECPPDNTSSITIPVAVKAGLFAMDRTCNDVKAVAKENNAVWLVVCTPPGCNAQDAELKALAARSAFPVKILTTLNGETVEMRKYTRSRKIRMFREYLSNSNEEVVVCTDANDVLANPGSPQQVLEMLSDELVVGGDTSCWTGEPCDQATLDTVTRIHKAHFDKVRKLEGGRMGYGAPFAFPNGGMYAGKRSAVLAYLDWAVETMDHYERFGVLPQALRDLLPTVSKLSDQGVLVAYWLTHPESVRVDVAGELFATLKRFFVLSGDDRGRRGRNASRPHHKAPRQISWKSLDRRDWPAASPFRAAPAPPNCSRLELPKKKFLVGSGLYCSDHDAFAGRFAYECPSAALALDGGAVKPLLAWHANGNAAKDFFYSLLGDLCRGKAGVCGE